MVEKTLVLSSGHNVSGLSDTDISSLADGDGLTYNLTASRWENSPLNIPTATTKKRALVNLSTNGQKGIEVAWENEVTDVGGWWDVSAPTRLTVPAGVTKVRVSSNIHTAGASSGQVAVAIRKGGSFANGDGLPASDTDTEATDFLNLQSSVMDVVEGDYFEVRSYVGANYNLTADPFTWFSIEEVSDSTEIVGAVLPVNTQSGASYTLTTNEADLIVMTNASSNTLTIPANSSVAIQEGKLVGVVQNGAGATTITAASGVTLNGVSAGSAAISTQYGAVSLAQVSQDVWVISGDHGAVS